MYATIILENGKTANTNEIKCPICGRKMEIDGYEIEIPHYSIDNKPFPFLGQNIKKETTYITTFKCPQNCGKFTVQHIVTSIVFSN